MSTPENAPSPGPEASSADPAASPHRRQHLGPLDRLTTPARVIERWFARRSASAHVVAVIASFIVLAVVNTVLDRLYAASNHPVSYAEGQTTFDAGRVEGFYATMSAAGTLDLYVYTQVFDYLFMVALAVFALTLGSLLRRAAAPTQPLMALARAGGVTVAVGAVFDAVENLISFVLLGFYATSDPAGFPDVLVHPYSVAAVIKFALVGLGLVLLLVSLIGLAGSLPGRLTGGRSRRASPGAASELERA